MKLASTLPEMLSQLLIVFTIELDNEWEKRYWIHAEAKPLRTSLVMWANFLRFVSHEGISVRELSKKAGYLPNKIHPDLAGMLRWRYVNTNSENPKRPKLDDTLQFTSQGAEAAETWKPLVNEIEGRWQVRFGKDEIEQLKQALKSIIATYDRPLPHYYPVLNHKDGMYTLDPDQPDCDPTHQLALPYLLSQAHQLFTLEAEKTSALSLAIRGNVLRVLEQEPIAKKLLPNRSGISKEALSMSINYLIKKGFVIEEPVTTGRGKAVRLTEQGYQEKCKYSQILNDVEAIWVKKTSTQQVSALKTAVLKLMRHDENGIPLLSQGLVVHPPLWRAKEPKRTVLPHHPMVLYRGGWPDGS